MIFSALIKVAELKDNELNDVIAKIVINISS